MGTLSGADKRCCAIDLPLWPCDSQRRTNGRAAKGREWTDGAATAPGRVGIGTESRVGASLRHWPGGPSAERSAAVDATLWTQRGIQKLPSPVRRIPVQMWAGASPVPVQMWAKVGPLSTVSTHTLQ